MFRGEEEAFFIVLFSDDLWKHLKKWIKASWTAYPFLDPFGYDFTLPPTIKYKKTANYYDYKDGDIAAYQGYFSLIKEREDLVFTPHVFRRVGNLDIIKFIYENRIQTCDPNAIDFALEANHPDIAKYLFEVMKVPFTEDTLGCSLCTENLEIVKWVYNNGGTPDERFLDGAISFGCVDILRWILGNIPNLKFSHSGIDSAAEGGQLEAIKFAYENIPHIYEQCAVDNAAREGHIEIVKYLIDNKKIFGYTHDAIDGAAANGHYNIVKYLLSIGGDHTSEAIDSAANGGYLEIIKLLHKAGGDCTFNAMDYAMRDGRLDIVKYLYLNRQEGYSTKGLMNAIINGHTHIIKWLSKNHKDDDDVKILDCLKSINREDLAVWLN